MLYEKELAPYLSQSEVDVITYAKRLVESNNATSYQMANELSYLMRRNFRYKEAVEIARMMYEASPSIERLNLYFVAVVDYGNISSIRQLSEMTDAFLKENGLSYQKHLFATWLKAANKIQDEDMFLYVYAKIPIYEKNNNTYIISQYYVYKNRRAQYEDVRKHYNQLSTNIQNARYVKNYYLTACEHLGIPPEPVPMPEPIPKPVPPVPSTNKTIFIVYGGEPAYLSVIETLLNSSKIPFINLSRENKTGRTIIEAFEEKASKADFAIVLCTPENEGKDNVWYARQNVILECGYFMAWLGRTNVCMLWQKNDKELELPSDLQGIYRISLDKGTWIEELRGALKEAGFHVTF